MDPDRPGEPLAYLDVDTGSGVQRVPIYDQLFIGRTCAGVNEQRRLVISDPDISRNHLVIHLDGATDHAFLIDTSTNGTLLNGTRLERAVSVPIKANDEIHIGNAALTFRSRRFTNISVAPTETGGRLTRARIVEKSMVMVAGDITNYSSISQVTDSTVIAESLSYLWQELGSTLRAHRGTLNHYAGDALYAVWDLVTPEACELAIDFALAANERVEELGPELPLRGPDGSPIHMGWGVAQGKAALAAMTRSVDAVIGDSTNMAFRLSGLAGRGGRAAVLVTDRMHMLVAGRYIWGPAEQVEIKGRSGIESVFPVLGRASTA